MKKTLAKRNGTVVFLPRYSNAEMLMLEFFTEDTISITPFKRIGGASHIVVQIHAHVDVLDELIGYVNRNI